MIIGKSVKLEIWNLIEKVSDLSKSYVEDVVVESVGELITQEVWDYIFNSVCELKEDLKKPLL